MGVNVPRFPWLKVMVAVSILLTLISLTLFTPLNSWLGNAQSQMGEFRAWKSNLGICFPAIYMLVYAIATVIGIPATLLTLAAGALFGLLEGTLWTVIGATLGAIGAFGTARFVARDWAKRQFEKGDRLTKLDQGIQKNGFWFALSIRLAPIFPFNAVNYLFGLTSISFSTYALATLVGIIPGTFAYTWLGMEGANAFQGNSLVRWQIFGALALLAILSLIPILLSRLTDRATKES
jgi:uncharacterized membrane protein YdjX (TVP38/TMEM64 family)